MGLEDMELDDRELEPLDREGRGRGWRWPVVGSGLLLTFFALAHSLEDFAFNVPRERFDIDPTPAGIMLAGAFLVQAVVLVLAWRGWSLGYAGAFVVAVTWFVAAALDHTGDLLDDSFREGFTSDALIAGTLIGALLLGFTSGAALWQRWR